MTGTGEKASDTEPLDLATMREAVNRLLDPDAVPDAIPPTGEELEKLTLQIRGHLDLLMPEVEAAVLKLSKNSVPRYCALACLGEAREKLRAKPGEGAHGAVAYARRLARALNALVDDYERLGKVGL